eukprot:gene24838-10489_t
MMRSGCLSMRTCAPSQVSRSHIVAAATGNASKWVNKASFVGSAATLISASPANAEPAATMPDFSNMAASIPDMSKFAMPNVDMPEMPAMPSVDMLSIDSTELVTNAMKSPEMAKVIATSADIFAYGNAHPEVAAAAGLGMLAVLIFVFRPRDIYFGGMDEEGGTTVVYKDKKGQSAKASMKESRTGEKLFSFKRGGD